MCSFCLHRCLKRSELTDPLQEQSMTRSDIDQAAARYNFHRYGSPFKRTEMSMIPRVLHIPPVFGSYLLHHTIRYRDLINAIPGRSTRGSQHSTQPINDDRGMSSAYRDSGFFHRGQIESEIIRRNSVFVNARKGGSRKRWTAR